MTKKVKFLLIMSASVFISAMIALALINFPELRVFPMNYDKSIPRELVEELNKMEGLSFVKIGQHGYNHSYGETYSDTIEGYEILKNSSLEVSYYIPPFEVAPRYTVPAELFMIPFESGGIWYSDEKLDYGLSTLNNSKAIAIHIQDEITMERLESMTTSREFEYLRLDDINTDIIETDEQIKRIYTAMEFCDRKGCTLVLGVIPHVLRMQESDKNYLFFNKMLIVIGVMMMIPIYIFYLISLRLSRWFE